MMLNILLICLLTFTRLSFSSAAAPVLSDSSKTMQHTVGQLASLSCTFKSASPVTFTWLQNGVAVEKSNRVYVNKLRGNMEILIIRSIKLSDEGDYKCIGKNEDGEDSGVIKLLILKNFIPKITDMPDVYVALNNTYTIQCTSEAMPQANYTWLKKNGFVNPNYITGANGVLNITIMQASDAGTYICTAGNKEGSSHRYLNVYVATITGWLNKYVPEVNVTAGKRFVWTAQIVSLVKDPKIVWYKDGNLLKEKEFSTTSNGAVYTSKLTIEDVNVGNSGKYKVAVDLVTVSGFSRDMDLIVWAAPKVVIDEGAELGVKEGKYANLLCTVQAYPLPFVQWKRNDSIITKQQANQTKTVSGHKTTLTFKLKVSKSVEGVYTCFSKNNQGTGSAHIKLVALYGGGDTGGSGSKTLLIVIIVLSVVAICIIVVAVILYVKFNDQWCNGYRYSAASAQFYDDLVLEEKDASTLADIENNPHGIRKNINISIKQKERTGMFSTGTRNQTSVKSLKSPTSTVAENHYARLGTIVCQGKAIDFKHIIFDEILGSGEYGFVNGGRVFEDDSTQYKDVSIKMLKDEARPQERRDTLAELRMMRRVSRHPNVVGLIGWCITDDNVYTLEEYVPFGSLLMFLRTHRLLSQSSESLEELDQEDRINQKTLLSFGWQIASGMKHLASLQVVHRDLACRNVYIGHEKICKISEYGLARDIYTENVYRKTTGGQLPVRWMAYESIFQGQYATESDVWSFGILLWELVTLGKIPYPGIVRTEQLLDEMESDYHMENPGHISTDLYLLMNSCWNRAPESRPTFTKLVKTLADFMNEENEIHIDVEKLFETEMNYEISAEDLLSPTSDFHRPPSFRPIEEHEEPQEPNEVAANQDEKAADLIEAEQEFGNDSVVA